MCAERFSGKGCSPDGGVQHPHALSNRFKVKRGAAGRNWCTIKSINSMLFSCKLLGVIEINWSALKRASLGASWGEAEMCFKCFVHMSKLLWWLLAEAVQFGESFVSSLWF